MTSSRLFGGLFSALWLLLSLISTPAAATSVIDSVRLHRAPDHTRIVFDLPAPVEHKLDKLTGPDRIVVDLEQAKLDFDINQLEYGDSPISNIRVGRHENGRTRVVFDLDEAVRPRTNVLKPVDPHGWRLVVDLFDTDPQPVKTMQETTAETGHRPMVVAIDAGHGGEDPGALGPSGTLEKNVVLQIAKRVYTLMKEEPGIKPVLIRDGDYYVPLAQRRAIAQQRHNADVFISIHADAFTDPRAHGASVFALSHSGATSARAKYLARMANESDKVAGVYEEERDNSGLLSVLADMTMSGSMAHSLYLGKQILLEMDGVTKLHGNRKRVEQAGFAVLKEPSMVSVLVETGFISNRQEERNLTNANHQYKLARAILNGTKSYFQRHPAPGSLFAAQREGGDGEYKIQPGDTLSTIARQYSVSEQALRAANDIDGDLIRVGQVIRIP
jgi:N-acetylmuramoyl-L-alanine amidase